MSILRIFCPDAGMPIIESEDAISKNPRKSKSAASSSRYRAENSVGYQIRATHLTFAKYLRNRLQPHKVTPGQWFFLRALWEEEGLSQRELSRRVGTTEPTTVSALRLLERNGLIDRVRNTQDRRTINIFLTPKGRELKDTLLPGVLELNRIATEGLSREEVQDAFRLLNKMRQNVAASVDEPSN
jgi:DNA-binding MarR family transcriptional regulator